MKPSLTKSALAIALALGAIALAPSALAQKPEAKGGAVLLSEPGKATAARTVQASAQVVAIDKATRTMTLKRQNGEVSDVVASEEVKRFDEIKVGDFIVVRYVEALTLELKKTKGSVGEPTVRQEAARAKPGEQPAGAVGRQVTAIATVTALDPKKSTITLKGPRGNVMTLPVQNPAQFKVVKKGDQIEVTYTEAVAIALEPAPKPAEKAK